VLPIYPTVLHFQLVVISMFMVDFMIVIIRKVVLDRYLFLLALEFLG